jgi:uncharacterized membrane protein YcaP (DUF421 family)
LQEKGGHEMEVYLTIVARTIFLYFLIVLIFRLMGKREIGELSILDLVVFLMIAEMAVMAIEDTKDPLIHTIIPMFLLMIIQISLAYLSLKNQIDDLMIQLRDKNISSVADVEFAILEPSGKLSVIEKQKDRKIQSGLQIPLIVDGKIQEENLQSINKNNLWLRQQLRKLGYNDIKQISLCTFRGGIFFIDLKDEK